MTAPVRVELLDGERLSDPAFVQSWRALRASTPHSTPFSSLAFASSVADALGYESHACVAYGDEQLSGGVLVYTRSIGPFKRVVVPPFVQYTPVLQSTDLDEHGLHFGNSVLQAVLQHLASHHHGVALSLLPETRDLRPATWARYHAQPLYTYRVKLDKADAMQFDWSSSARRVYRRHADSYTLRRDPRHVPEVIDLCAQGYRRHGRTLPVDASRLDSLVQLLQQHGCTDVLTLHNESTDEVEAGIVLLRDEVTAHYWIAGSKPGPAMTVLLGRAFDYLMGIGVQRFDFVGANTPSIAEFKRRFGPRLESYYRIEHHRSRLLRIIEIVRGRG